MSEYHDPPPSGYGQPPLRVIPVRQRPEPTGSPFRWIGRAFLLLLFLDAIILHVVVFLVLVVGFSDGLRGDASVYVNERFHSGKSRASDKIAIVHIDGVLMEGMNHFAQKEIERAATDKAVKAVVLRINSPGGSITA